MTNVVKIKRYKQLVLINEKAKKYPNLNKELIASSIKELVVRGYNTEDDDADMLDSYLELQSTIMEFIK